MSCNFSDKYMLDPMIKFYHHGLAYMYFHSNLNVTCTVGLFVKLSVVFSSGIEIDLPESYIFVGLLLFLLIMGEKKSNIAVLQKKL